MHHHQRYSETSLPHQVAQRVAASRLRAAREYRGMITPTTKFQKLYICYRSFIDSAL